MSKAANIWEFRDWEREITSGDIPEQYWYIVAAIGVDGFIRLVRCAEGQASIHLPKIDKMMASIRNKHIGIDYNGYNINALATKYGITAEHVRNILREEQESSSKQIRVFNE